MGGGELLFGAFVLGMLLLPFGTVYLLRRHRGSAEVNKPAKFWWAVGIGLLYGIVAFSSRPRLTGLAEAILTALFFFAISLAIITVVDRVRHALSRRS